MQSLKNNGNYREWGRRADGSNLGNFHKEALEEKEQLQGHLKFSQRGKLSRAECDVMKHPKF